MFDAVVLSYRSAGQLPADKRPVAADAVEIYTWNKDKQMKILLASSIDPGAISELEKYHEVVCAFGAGEEELLEKMPGTEILVFRSGVQINAKVLEAGAPDLCLLLRAGSGTDNIDLDYVAEHGLRLERIPGPGAKAVAELAFSLMLGLARNVQRADRLLRDGVWAKSELTGFLLTGKTLGVVGAGNIGTRVGELGAAWGMNVIGCVGEPDPVDESRLAAKGMQLKSFTEVMKKNRIEVVDPVGEPFDHELHQAISMVENPDVEPNTVIAVMQKGYTLNGRLMRPAMVMVSKAAS